MPVCFTKIGGVHQPFGPNGRRFSAGAWGKESMRSTFARFPIFFEGLAPWRETLRRHRRGKPKCPRDTNIPNFCSNLGSLSCTKKNLSLFNSARENRRYIPRTHVVPCPRPVPPGGYRSLGQVNIPSEPAHNVIHSSRNRMGPSTLPPPILQAESRADEWRGALSHSKVCSWKLVRCWFCQFLCAGYENLPRSGSCNQEAIC
jgi:hypothetical protein